MLQTIRPFIAYKNSIFSFINILRREPVKKKFNYYNTDVTMQFLAQLIYANAFRRHHDR